jgi:hypothetical protein
MAVKALTFDIIGTVFDWLDSFSTEVVPLAQEYALSIDPRDADRVHRPVKRASP